MNETTKDVSASLTETEYNVLEEALMLYCVNPGTTDLGRQNADSCWEKLKNK